MFLYKLKTVETTFQNKRANEIEIANEIDQVIKAFRNLTFVVLFGTEIVSSLQWVGISSGVLLLKT